MDYAKDFKLREDMIWKAITSFHVLNPAKYRLTMSKKYGPILMEAVEIAREPLKKECIAVAQRMVDEALSKKHGWMTREEWRKS